ncbi:MAG: hypothetical protein ACRCZ3_17420, partial [Providencia rustigianii]|uniref:hypothetical protein n=1 Tax=Providencia rustigianii TaxID=158850 RepID=UPI003F3A5AC6
SKLHKIIIYIFLTALVSDWIGIGRSSEFAVLKKWYRRIPNQNQLGVQRIKKIKFRTVSRIRVTDRIIFRIKKKYRSDK